MSRNHYGGAHSADHRQSRQWRWRNDRRSERNLCNCVKKPEKKFRTSTGFEPVTSWYQCDALPTELWSHWRWEQVSCGFICSSERNECQWYEINHIWTAKMKWRSRNDRRSERNLCNCVKNLRISSAMAQPFFPPRPAQDFAFGATEDRIWFRRFCVFCFRFTLI